MKVVLLAGGFGTRLSEETDVRPKPMVEIGGMPILWHIMKIYASHGFNDFIICCGYKAAYIKNYFANYARLNSDISVDLQSGEVKYINRPQEDWKITLVDTGLHTMTGGRVKRVAEHLNGESFMLTYGDGVADVDIKALVKFHKSQGKKATVTAVPSPGRFGVLEISDDKNVSQFSEKPKNEMGMINGGFFVLENSVLDYITEDSTIWEQEPLKGLAADGELAAFSHDGFWRPMDSLRDKRQLEELWNNKNAPWKNW
jgi:glucose-1-phosphate cytidylyltransferase